MMRPLGDDDLNLETLLDADPEVLRYLYGRARTPQEVFQSHCRRMELGATGDGLGYWILYADRDFAGLMMLPPADEPGVAELGYRLRREHWGQGIATEASRELLRHGFETVGLKRVFAQTMAVNLGSRAVMQAVGMRYVRTFHPIWDDPLPGAEEGEVEYELTAEEWRDGHHRRDC
ncbi:GNAT family N-acetyltransferase [Actinoplanes sp. NPDC023936]|uniref:GNAT family N-acetyltransferase n=1 Tax=Actinoplanes sp. NPDC023936 TaxID=3154910 RepID=UPI0033CB0535